MKQWQPSVAARRASGDSYVVDNAGDVVTELVDGGTDTVLSSINYVLGANVERLTLTGTLALSGTGNELANVLTANDAGDFLSGLGGNDTLKGGAGTDMLFGGAGNDLYVIGDAADVVTELADEGVDTVLSSIDYTLGAYLENLVLTGANVLSGIGNELNNVLSANAQGSSLSGLAGNDTLKGAGGYDTLEGGAGADRLNGGAAADTYLFGRGDGPDTVVDVDGTAGVQDVLKFGGGVAADQLWLRNVNNNVEISVIGTSDKVTISGWYVDTAHHVEVIQLASGEKLLDRQVQDLVQAMASFSPPPLGQTTLSTSYRNALEPVIAANWQ